MKKKYKASITVVKDKFGDLLMIVICFNILAIPVSKDQF